MMPRSLHPVRRKRFRRRAWTSGFVTALVVVTLVSPAAAHRPSEPSGPSATANVGLSRKYPLGGAGGPTAEELVAAAEAATPAAASPGGLDLMASGAAGLAPCEDDPAFLCGTLPVPLDRRSPDGRVVHLHVEVFPHTGPQDQADGAVFITCGGPGCSITLGAKYGYAFFLLPDVAQTRDLVFVDQRGVGLSDVIDCPDLQAGGPLYPSAATCHNQLGDTADLYSTTDVADDLEAVRHVLGYPQIDVFGASYAGADMMAYAQRYPERVRSSVLSSPAVVVGTDPFYPYAPEAMPGIVAGVCGRSPACAAANPDPAASVASTAELLRNDPVSGTGIDSSGVPHDVRVTENLLANWIMYFNGAHFTGPGEITPGAAALRQGDPVPLLRLAADVGDPANGFASDLREFSVGHSLARSCVDGEFAWDKDAAPGVRGAQYAAAYAAQPPFYGPISRRAWAAPGYFGFQPNPCIASSWEDRPIYPAGTRVEGVPTLVLGGEYDLPVPESVAQLATEVMVDSTYVSMTAAGHDPHFWSDCGPELVQRFILDLAAGDTSCADEPAAGWWVPGSFPTTVADAPPAAQTSGPFALPSLRRLATIAAWTVMDSVQHNFFVPGDGVALRGGLVDYEFVDTNQWTLVDARFTEDVAVDGVVRDTDRGPPIVAKVTVTGPDGVSHTMQISGDFLSVGADMTITVIVRGRPATFTVPGF